MKSLISGELAIIEAMVMLAVEAMQRAGSITELQEATAGLFAAGERLGALKDRTEGLAIAIAQRDTVPDETEVERERRMKEWGQGYARCQLENCLQWGNFPFTPIRATLFAAIVDHRDLDWVIEGYERYVDGARQFAGDIQRITLKDLRRAPVEERVPPQ